MRMNRTADQPEPNPLREGLSTRAVPQPCSIVIFGATGDLTIGNLSRRFIIWRPMANCHRGWSSSVSLGGQKRRRFSARARRIHAEVFASSRARRNLERVCTIAFSIIRASSAMKPVISRWPNVSKSSTRNGAPAAIVFSIWRPGLTSSNRS